MRPANIATNDKWRIALPSGTAQWATRILPRRREVIEVLADALVRLLLSTRIEHERTFDEIASVSNARA